MRICDFCLQLAKDGTCAAGLKMPASMTCREFGPTIERFCADPKDFVDPRQIHEMATYFGIKGAELRKVKLIATAEVKRRLELVPPC